MQIDVSRENDTGTERHVWQFILRTNGRGDLVPTIRLNRYKHETRETRRHKWRRNGLFYSSDTIDDWRQSDTFLPQKDTPLPDDVRTEAISMVMQLLVVDVPEGHYEKQQRERCR